MDVAIVGAGVVGCATARLLAREGLEVVVLDRDDPGRHASWAAAGMLAPQAETDRPGPFLDLLLRARGCFPALARDLKEETGLDVGYRTDGMILGAFDDTEAAELRGRHDWQREAGLPVDCLSPEEARKLERVLSQKLRSALFFAGDHQVDNRQLVRALWFSAHAAGARFLSGATVTRVSPEGDSIRVETQTGETIRARKVVIAAGSWSGAIPGLPRTLPVEPVHGQLIALDTAPPVLRHIVASRRGYLVPRSDGRLIVGATVERVGFRGAVTPAGLRQMTEVAMELAPDLASRRVLAHWSGFRPGTPDGLPILGADPEAPSVIYATGHFRNGILLAPLTAEIVTEIVRQGRSRLDLAAFRPDRF